VVDVANDAEFQEHVKKLSGAACWLDELRRCTAAR
jgi:hypothetical protein